MLRRRVRLRRADRCCRVRHPRRGRPTTARCGRRSRHPRLYGSTQRRGRERRRVEKLAVRQPLLKEVPEHVPYAFVREPRGATHYAVASRLRPLCNCACPSASRQRKAGDVACICRCHREGPKHTPALCGKKPARCWTVSRKTTGRVCQSCHALACAGPPAYVAEPTTLRCSVPCPFRRGAACGLPPNHLGLHSAPAGKGKVSW